MRSCVVLQFGGDAGEDFVDIVVEGFALFLILLDELHGLEDLFFFVREAAEVEVVAACGDLVYGVALGFGEVALEDFLTVVPPCFDGVEVLEAHGLCLAEVLVALGHVEAVEPGLLGRVGAVEEEDVRRDARIGREDAAGQPYDGVQVALGHELLLDVDFRVVGTEEEAVGQDDGGAATLLESIEDDAHEEVGRLTICEVVGEVAHDVFLLAAAVWRIHEDLVELVFLRVVEDVVEQAVAVVDVGVVDAVQQQVRDGEHVGELLLLDAVDGVVPEGAVVGRHDLLLELAQPADEETAGAAGEVSKVSVFDTIER